MASDPAWLYTIGYEGKTADCILKELWANGVERLVDVRAVAMSRKPGFSKGALSEFLKKNGLEYVHLNRLGSPKNARDELRVSGDFGAFSSEYSSHLLSVSSDLDMLARLAFEKPTAIMCFESDVTACHRSIIADMMRKKGFEIIDL